MAYLKFSCNDGKPCFQHDGGSGYVESGNRLLVFSRDEYAFPADSNRVDFLNSHRRMIEIRFVPALYPQNWTVQVDDRGIGQQEKVHLEGLSAKINETIAGRDEFQLADFFLYYSAAYDFQVVWAANEESILPPAWLKEAESEAENGLFLVYRGAVPLFSLGDQVDHNDNGPVVRFFSKPALRSGKTDSIDIALLPTYEGSGTLHFAAGIKTNNYGAIPPIALNQAFWSNLLNVLNEALPQKRELDLTQAVSFLRDAYDMTVFTPVPEVVKEPQKSPSSALKPRSVPPKPAIKPAASENSGNPSGQPSNNSFLAPFGRLLIRLGNFLAGK